MVPFFSITAFVASRLRTIEMAFFSATFRLASSRLSLASLLLPLSGGNCNRLPWPPGSASGAERRTVAGGREGEARELAANQWGVDAAAMAAAAVGGGGERRPIAGGDDDILELRLAFGPD